MKNVHVHLPYILINLFINKNVFVFNPTGSFTSRSHQSIILAQRKKNERVRYWAPVISREKSIVLAIAWYIVVELLRTKQLPEYITFAGIHRVPSLTMDIQDKAARVYTDIFRKNDTLNKFYVADTGHSHLDGKVGVILSYDTVKCHYVTRIQGQGHGQDIDSIDISLSPENMVPYRKVYTQSYIPSPSSETCTISLTNHFSDPNSVSPCLTFHSDIFSSIGGTTRSPHTGGQVQRDRLIELIEEKELKLRIEAEKVQLQQAELERGVAKLYATHSPVQVRPRKKIRGTHGPQNAANSKQQINSRAVQVSALWKAKFEHLVSRRKEVHQGHQRDDNHVNEHMFTYPFKTIDNSLHQSSSDLPEFSHYTGQDGLNDAVYGKNDIASSIIIDGNSVSSVTPGSDMDDNIINFCLSW